MASRHAEALSRVSNPPNPWHSTSVDWLGEPPAAELVLYDDASRSILARNDSPDITFTWSVNPYRGCTHACAYCYARPSHQYLDFGAGTDFERRIVVKRDAAELLRAAFAKRSWTGELIVFSGNTDCYQPLEATLGLTRACLEVCAEHRNPVGVITKSAIIERDVDVLQDLARDARCSVNVSIPFWDPDDARAIEPGVPTPKRRLKAVERLAAAGIEVGVMVAPIIPGLNDTAIPKVLEAAADAGAKYASRTLVRLPGPLADVFEERIRAALPLRADKILSAIRDCRGGAITESRFHRRQRGLGARWQAVERLWRTSYERFGYRKRPEPPEETTFRRPGAVQQLGLGL